MSPPGVVAVVLAAGASRRLGQPKQLVDWGGRPLLEHILVQVRSWPVRSIIAVIGYRAEELIRRIDFDDAVVVVNPEWKEGMASSLRVGLAAAGDDASLDSALVVMGDQPDIGIELVRQLIGVRAATRSRVVVPRYRYAHGYPILVGRELWERLMGSSGEDDPLALLAAHPDWVKEVWVDRLSPRGIDTAEDVEDLRPA